MSYNRETNIDDLIALTTANNDMVNDKTYYLVLQEYDGRGAFSNPPFVYGLSQVVHDLREDELSKTVGELLQQYPNGPQFLDSKDEYNLVTHNQVQVKPQDTLKTIFGGDTKATLYLQNRACKAYQVLEGEEKSCIEPEGGPVKRFNWRKCFVIFLIGWILKFVIVFVVILILKYFGVL